MKIAAIISEYNPLHNGHIYHIEKTREKAGAVIAVMSGNYVQRGEPAVIGKWQRAEFAVKNGIDLVIELPTPFAVSGAKSFARGAVGLIDSLGCIDYLSFGSESGKIEELENISELLKSAAIEGNLKKGMNYPAALGKEIKELTPNNILAVEYIKALKELNSEIEPITIKRTGVMHGESEAKDGFCSSSFIRKNVDSAEELSDFLPCEVFEYIKANDTTSLYNAEREILYSLKTDTKYIGNEEIKNKIVKYCDNTNHITEFLNAVKSKNFTMSAVKRAVLKNFLQISKTLEFESPPYARILAFNKTGEEILKTIKKNSKIPVSQSLKRLSGISEECKKFADAEISATRLYGHFFKSIKTGVSEFTQLIKKF